jgi:hypothetical protein
MYFGQQCSANPFDEHSKATKVSLSSPKTTRWGATIEPAERTGEPTFAVHTRFPSWSTA